MSASPEPEYSTSALVTLSASPTAGAAFRTGPSKALSLEIASSGRPRYQLRQCWTRSMYWSPKMRTDPVPDQRSRQP
ncbi:hypothetical protein FHR65_003908 [Xanthomonas arboricola]|uniref:Uncharacterized protein n=1 Tax=Xanthomonas arboricola TaxID=56448 RepID=A0AB73H2F1_9XANT|nr:hypothetical protein [Xanthomonas arboricola]